LTKSARVFRIKSLVMKLYRALLVLEVVSRLLQRNPEKRIARLEVLLAEKEHEIDEIKSEISFLADRISMKTLPVAEIIIEPQNKRKAA